MISGNIKKLKTLVSDFDKNVRLYNSSINSYFGEIKTFDGWGGDKATSYLSIVDQESEKYLNFGDELNSFIDVFSGIIDELEDILSKSKK